MAHFDLYGWYSAAPIVGREAPEPPSIPAQKVVGQPYPNWTGVEWVMVPYFDPPAPPDPAEQAVVATTSPITKLQFLDLLTDAEIGNILDAAKTVKPIAVFVKKLELAGDINLSDPRTIAALNALEAAGLLGSGRAARILTGKLPQ